MALLASWVVVGVLASLAPVSASAAVSTPAGFTPMSPSRLLDTRTGVGYPEGPGGRGWDGAPAGHRPRRGARLGGVGGGVEVTVTAPTRPGYLTVYGDGAARPTVSNLNYVAAQTVPNLVIGPVGAGGKVAKDWQRDRKQLQRLGF